MTGAFRVVVFRLIMHIRLSRLIGLIGLGGVVGIIGAGGECLLECCSLGFLLRLDFVVVFGLLYGECLVGPVIIHGQTDGVKALHDLEVGGGVEAVFAGIDELSAGGVESECGEDGLHVVVEDVDDELAVVGVHVVFLLLVYGAEGLCAGVLGVGGEGKQTTVQLSELQRISDAKALADYKQRHAVDEQSQGEGQQATTDTPTEASTAPAQAETAQSGVVDGAPEEFAPDMEVTIHDEDGTDKPAMVMGRVRYENGGFVPDENGSIIEYYMDGQVKHDHEDALRGKVVSHVVERAEGEEPQSVGEYGVNDGFTMLDAAGNAISGEVQGISEDGVEIRTDTPLNGKRVQVIPVEEFERMVESISDAEGNTLWERRRAEEPVKENEVQPTEQSVPDNSMENDKQPISEEQRTPSDEHLRQYAQDAYHDAMTDNGLSLPQGQVEQMQQRNKQMLDAENARKEAETHREPTALERIPVDEKTGEPMFEKADRETALAALGELTGGSEANTEAIVNAQATQANKELEALRKKQPTRKAPKLSGSPMAMIKAQQMADAQYNAAMEQYNAQVAAATEKAKAWGDIAATMREKQRAVREQQEAQRKEQDARVHAEAVAKLEEDKRIAAEKAAEQKEVGIHAVNPKIKEKWDKAKKVEGNANAITLADGSSLRGHYVLTEAGAASASHDASNGFEPTEGFPIDKNGESVNDRDYRRDKDAQRIVQDIADNYDSRALQTPVVVSKDGVVLSGNNRTMSGEIAARQGSDKAYVDYLKEFGKMYGFTPEQIEGMEHPRVLFVADEDMPYDANTFARFNAETQKKQSKPEMAVKLGKTVPDKTFTSIASTIGRYDRLSDFYADAKAVNDVLGELHSAGVINDMQLPELRTGNTVSAVGRELIENALIGKVFQASPDAVRQIIATPTLRQAIIMGLNEIAHNRTLAKSGYDLGRELGAAVDLVARAKAEEPDIYKEGVPVSPYGRQQGLFDEEMGDSRITDVVTLLLADVLNSGKPSDLRKFIASYNAEATIAAAGQLDMFSGDVRSKEQILNDINNYFQNATPRELQERVDAAIAERIRNAESGRDETVEQGAVSDERNAEYQPAVAQEEQKEERHDEKYVVSSSERAEMENRITDWLSEENLEHAVGKTRDEIFEEFGNELAPIAYIPAKYLSFLSENVKDPRIYCGKGYFIDHALRNHGGQGTQINIDDVDVSKYLNIQYVLDNPDHIKEILLSGKTFCA